jgi:hypothetical protein
MHQGSYLTSAIIANMRLLPAAGVAMAAGVGLLGLDAAGEDDYYGGGVFVLLGFVRKRTSELWLIPAFALYGLSLAYAWAVLSLGH